MDMHDVTDIATAAWDDSELNAKEDGIAVNVATDAAKTADKAWHDIF
jgi:hypothetical protein